MRKFVIPILLAVAVVMASSTRDARNEAATRLLDYGFNNYSYIHYDAAVMEDIKVIGGNGESVGIYSEEFGTVADKSMAGEISVEIVLPEYLTAPVKKGSVVGEIVYKTTDGREIGRCDIIANGDVDERTFGYQFKKIFEKFLMY
jgi:D-alanyl-D-alanine carboxypeptidase (penicillin-binding protein 5/6)